MKLLEMIFDEEAMANGVDAISLVKSPAIESNFVALSKTKSNTAIQILMNTINAEKRLVMGAVLIPNKPIQRIDAEGEPFHIYFSKDTIRKASQFFFKRGYQNSATLEHSIKLQGVTVVESWIKEDENMDKSNLYKLDAPVGSWIAAMLIDNDEIWDEYVKTGKVLGFSIEGWFKDKPAKMSTEKKTAKIIKWHSNL